MKFLISEPLTQIIAQDIKKFYEEVHYIYESLLNSTCHTLKFHNHLHAYVRSVNRSDGVSFFSVLGPIKNEPI